MRLIDRSSLVVMFSSEAETPDHGRDQRVLDGEGGGVSVTAIVRPRCGVPGPLVLTARAAGQ